VAVQEASGPVTSFEREAAAAAATESSSEEDDFDFSDCDYHVVVTTGDRPDAGTTANVFVEIFGDHGDTGEVFLRNEQIDAPFTRSDREQRLATKHL
jgi:hypothetical protein